LGKSLLISLAQRAKHRRISLPIQPLEGAGCDRLSRHRVSAAVTREGSRRAFDLNQGADG